MPLVLDPAPIALLAGGGTLPALLIQTFQSQNRPFVVIGFEGQTDSDLVKNIPHLMTHFGAVGKILAYLQEHHIQEIVMAGSMTRPLMRDIRPDWEGMKWMGRLLGKAIGDDTLLRSLIELIEENGLRVIGPDTLLKDIVVEEGPLTSFTPTPEAYQDIAQGMAILEALSPLDVGQAVVLQEGIVLGIEAIEGTQGLLNRVTSLHRPGPGGILVKMTKKGQEKRVDLPTIGPETIVQAQKAGLQGIAVEAGQTLILNRRETLKYAQKAGLFVLGLKRSS